MTPDDQIKRWRAKGLDVRDVARVNLPALAEAAPPPAQSEAAFQAAVLVLAKANGWTLIYHTLHSRGSEAGFPDLVLLRPRRRSLLVLECKTDTGIVSDAQAAWLAGFVAAGVDARVVRPHQWPEIVAVLAEGEA